MVFEPPQDIVVIFHTSFHPTRGNVLDWYFSADEDIDVENLGLEFSALPSGLHQIDDDVIYFTASGKRKTSSSTPAQPPLYHALALFRRRRTAHPLYRGFLLGSLGILVAPSPDHTPQRVRPWRHLGQLRAVAERCYSHPGSEPSLEADKLVDVEIDTPGDWFEPAKEFFEVCRAHGGGRQSGWTSWKDELHDEVRFWLRQSSPSVPALTHITPTLALPSLLTLLGPASLTLYRHLLTRKRILFYTKPPVEYACAVCYAAADMVRSIQEREYERQQQEPSYKDNEETTTKIPPRHKLDQPARVLGMVTLHDLLSSKLTEDHDNDNDNDNDEEPGGGQGWIACTTDALFLEKPAYYDLLVDLTSVGVSSSSTVAFTSRSPSSTSTSNSAASWVFGSGSSSAAAGRPRPTMYISVPKHPTLPLPAVTASGKYKASKSKKGKSKKNKKQVQYKRVQTRWAWSDARLWGELDRVLRAPPSLVYSTKKSATTSESDTSNTSTPVDAVAGSPEGCKSCGGPLHGEGEGSESSGSSSTCTANANAKANLAGTGAGAWLADAWQLYEEVCLICAGAWMGTLRTRNLGLQAYPPTSSPEQYDDTESSNAAGRVGGALSLKRSFSTPYYTTNGGGKYPAASMTMPARGHKHARSISDTRPRRRTGPGPSLADRPNAGTTSSPAPRLPLVYGQFAEPDILNADSSLLVDVDTDEEVQHLSHDHDFTLVSPPDPDTRDGLDILLHTAEGVSSAGFPPNLAEAVSKTEGALTVLDVYAGWVVGLVRSRVQDAVKNGSGEGSSAVEEDEEEIEEDMTKGVEQDGQTGGREGEQGEQGGGGARTSAIELTSVGEGLARRSTPPPPIPKTEPPRKVRDVLSKRTRKGAVTMTLTPRDLLALDLNPLSAVDSKYLEGVVGEYASRAFVVRRRNGGGGTSGEGGQSAEEVEEEEVLQDIHVRLSVKRGWRDLVGVVFGL